MGAPKSISRRIYNLMKPSSLLSSLPFLRSPLALYALPIWQNPTSASLTRSAALLHQCFVLSFPQRGLRMLARTEGSFTDLRRNHHWRQNAVVRSIRNAVVSGSGLAIGAHTLVDGLLCTVGLSRLVSTSFNKF